MLGTRHHFLGFAAVMATLLASTRLEAQVVSLEDHANRHVFLLLKQDFSLRMSFGNSTSSASVSKRVAQHLKSEAAEILPMLFKTCEFDQAQIRKQQYAVDVSIRSVERAINTWSAIYCSEPVDAALAQQGYNELIDLNAKIDDCFWAPGGLFQKILQGQLSEGQRKLYKIFLRKRKDKLAQFVRALARSAVLSTEQLVALEQFLSDKIDEHADRSLRGCAKFFLQISQEQDDTLHSLLDERELAAARRLCNYFIDAKR